MIRSSSTKKPILVKLGGSALKENHLTQILCQDLAKIQESGIPLVLVHGGGPAINEELKMRGITWDFFNGQRITTDDMMDVIEMVLCGKVNRSIVRRLNSCGAKAVGFSGTDCNFLLCSPAEARLGRVGVIESVNTGLLSQFLNLDGTHLDSIIPVIAPIGVDSNGVSYNINADWAASKIAEALDIQEMIYITDQDGILDAEGRLQSELQEDQLLSMIEQRIVTGGMLTKTNTILSALQNGIDEIHIINGNRPHSIIAELFSDISIGTLCYSRNKTHEVQRKRA